MIRLSIYTFHLYNAINDVAIKGQSPNIFDIRIKLQSTFKFCLNENHVLVFEITKLLDVFIES